MKSTEPPAAPLFQLLALLEQVEFVLAATSPVTAQQIEVWPQLRRRAKEARAAVKANLRGSNT